MLLEVLSSKFNEKENLLMLAKILSEKARPTQSQTHHMHNAIDLIWIIQQVILAK